MNRFLFQVTVPVLLLFWSLVEVGGMGFKVEEEKAASSRGRISSRGRDECK
jgi:hypothetical protein